MRNRSDAVLAAVKPGYDRRNCYPSISRYTSISTFGTMVRQTCR
jgi:hypothetical protein